MVHDMPERYRYHISNEELERRWSAVRAKMTEQDIDCLVINGYDNMLGGYLRWFTDIPLADYPLSVLFHREDEMTFIGHGGVGTRSIAAELARGVGEAPATPMMPTLCYTDRYVPDLMIESIKRRNYRKVGFVALATIPASMYKYLTEELGGVEFVDATELVDYIKAIKSPEEIERIRWSAAVHDKVYAAMPAIFRPDRYEYEITNDIRALGGELGAECIINVSIGTDPNTPVKGVVPWQYRRTKMGDKMFCLIELNGPGDYYSEALRTLVLGEPPKEYVQAADTAAKCLDLIASMMKPGAKCPDLFRANNEYLVAHGYLPEGRLFGHGQGYDMVERPAFVPAETMALAENMYVACHPGAVDGKVVGLACSNFLITKDGCERVTTTPNGLIIC